MKRTDLKMYEPELSEEEKELINKCIEKFGGYYLGKWCLKTVDGSWTLHQVPYIFYQPNPDTSKGHSNYYGIFKNLITKSWIICNGKSAFEPDENNDIIGIVDDGLVYVSRDRHNYITTPNNHFIDGGRDYLRYGINENDSNKENGKLVKVVMNNGTFEFYDIGDKFANYLIMRNEFEFK